MIAHDIQHQLHALGVHGLGQVAKTHAGAGQVFIDLVEIHPPIAVVAGLAFIREDAATGGRNTAGETFVGVINDGRDPDRGEAHRVDVVQMIGDAFEVAAHITDVAGHAIAGRQRNVEGVQRAALVALVIAGVAIDEAVGHHEVHRLAGEGFQRAVVVLGCLCVAARRGACAGGKQAAGKHRKSKRMTHRESSHAVFSVGRRTRNTHRPATIMLAPPIASAWMGCPPSKVFSRKPNKLAATNCGITIKKLKMPI